MTKQQAQRTVFANFQTVRNPMDMTDGFYDDKREGFYE